MARPMTSILLALDGVTGDDLTDAGRFADGLAQHVAHVHGGISSVLAQIGMQQQAYVRSQGCTGCLRDRCMSGCRMQLLRRVLAVGLPTANVRVVPLGLVPRGYVRHYVLLPTRRARLLDGTVLGPWSDARMALHLRRCRRGISVVGSLSVGDGPDARPHLRALGWRAVATPALATHGVLALVQLLYRPVEYPGALLLPRSATSMPAQAGPGDLDGKTLQIAATTAGTVAQHIQGLGARLECLDVDTDLRTTRILAVATADGTQDLVAGLRGHEVLRLQQDDPITVVLNPAGTCSALHHVPLLRIGDRPTGSSRWRPLSSVHHLGMVGPVGGEMLAGMLLPAIASHPDVRIAVLDLVDGRLARSLAGIPQRLPTANADDLAEVLGAIGRLPTERTCVVAIVVADRAAAAHEAVTALLRMGLYRDVSLILVVPQIEELPPLLRDRLPIVLVREQGAEWHARNGHWRWAMPTALRLPWRDPTLSWRDVVGTQPAVDVPDEEAFWALPPHLIDGGTPTSDRADTAAETLVDGNEPHSHGAAGDPGLWGDEVPASAAEPYADTPAGVDGELLARVVAWADTHGGQTDGVSIRRLEAEMGLPNKDTAAAVIAALHDHDLVLAEHRKGWFHVRSLADAHARGLIPLNAADEPTVSSLDAPAVR